MKLFATVGHAAAGANHESLAAFERAAHELRCFIGDPVATVEAALATSPEMTMAHVLKAYLHLLGTEPAGIPVVRASYEAARELPANDRERGHLEAVRLLAEGRWREAGRTLEDVSVAYPRDALALQAGHQIDFFTGDSRMLRDRIARAAGVEPVDPRLSRAARRARVRSGEYAECVRLLRPIRNIANRFGGSHAQRDLIDLTLIEAAFRAGGHALAAERNAVRPDSPLARLFVARASGLAKAA